MHPLVTLLEKLDAIHRRFPDEKAMPATFVRHYEDAARLVDAGAKLPALTDYANAGALAGDMLAQKQLVALPAADDPALLPSGEARWGAIRNAHAAIGGTFWGPRLSLDQSCAIIRAWVAAEFGGARPR